MYCAGAGTAADCDHVTEMVKRDMELHRLNTGMQTRVNHVVRKFSDHLFNYQGYVGVHTIIGGTDVKGPHLCQVDSHGNTQFNPFLTMGSGSLAAMAIMETEYKDNMTEEEAITLITHCVEAGIYHDLGSGSNVDIAVIKKDATTVKRSVKSDNYKMFAKPGGYDFPKGTTTVLESSNIPLDISDGQAPMEL